MANPRVKMAVSVRRNVVTEFIIAYKAPPSVSVLKKVIY